MPDSNLLPSSLREEKHFRWRGGEVSRIEGLSDAVFVPNVPWLSGVFCFPMGPAHGFNGFKTGNAIERAASQAPSEP